jgi:anti-anti-sigma factor
MNFTIDRTNDVAIVRLDEARLMYPLLADFAGAVTGLLDGGDRKVLLDFSKVTYVDSATIGCLMDLYRQASGKGGALKLAGVQKRVETMLTMTNTQKIIEVHPDAASALASFGG